MFGAYKIYVHEQKFYATAVRTTGRVTELVPKRSNDGTTFSPRVEFADVSGKTIQFVSSASSKPPAWDVGDTVKVVYQKNLPDNAEIDSFMSHWGSVLVLGFMGLVFAAVGINRIFQGRL